MTERVQKKTEREEGAWYLAKVGEEFRGERISLTQRSLFPCPHPLPTCLTLKLYFILCVCVGVEWFIIYSVVKRIEEI